MNIPVTEWFPAEVKPTIPGYYQRLYANNEHDLCSKIPDYWNGKRWLLTDTNGKGEIMGWATEELKWRGLTSPHPEWKP